MNWRAGLLVGSLGLAALMPFGCGGGDDGNTRPDNTQKKTEAKPDGGQPDAGQPDAGEPDGGTLDGGQTDGGHTDGGTTDGGTLDGGTDGGSVDGGTDGGTSDGGIPEPPHSTVTELPPKAGFQLFSFRHDDGSPVTVNGITADEGGNLWVAGGTDGLFLLRKGSSKWEQFTLKDGLHPYGYDIDGNDLPPPYYLDVLSVSGGPAGTVFVGYRGRPEPGSAIEDDRCENNWDTLDPNRPDKDPTIYQSGDADRVTLDGSGGIDVVHFDIFSGPEMVPLKCSTLDDGTYHCTGEPAGRERVCSVYRILYDRNRSNVWFGGNHGFAWGDPNYKGIQATHCYGPYKDKKTPSFGNYNCSGILEHAHPLVEASNGGVDTFRYYGLATSPSDGSLWVGGWIRSVHYGFGNHGDGFWTYEGNQSSAGWYFDVWSDHDEDAISSVAAMGDGSAWIGSFSYGLAHVGPDGSISYLTDHGGLPGNGVSALARDTSGGESLWIGERWGEGLARLKGGHFQYFSLSSLGLDDGVAVSDIQIDTASSPRLVLVGFASGTVGIYAGE